MKIFSVEDAKKKKLVQIIMWQHCDLFEWVKAEHDRMQSVNKKREVMIVERRGRYAVFANKLA